MLKIKHVPEQLLDVTRHAGDVPAHVHVPVRRRLAGSTEEYLQYILPGMLVQSVLFTAVYSGRRAEHRRDQGRHRPLPLAADLARRAAGRRGVGDAVRYVFAGDRRDGARLRHGLRRRRRRPRRARRRSRSSSSSRSALSWVFTTLGMILRAPNAVMNAGLHGPLPADLPQQHLRRARDAAGGLKTFVDVNPISHLDHRGARADGGRGRRGRHRCSSSARRRSSPRSSRR